MTFNPTKRMCGQDRGIINAIVNLYEDEVTRCNVINQIDGQYNLDKVAVILRKEVRGKYRKEMKDALKLPKIDDEDAFFNTITVVVDEKKIDATVKRILALFPRSLRKAPAKKVAVEVWKPKKIKAEIVEEECTKPPTQNQYHLALDALVEAAMHDSAACEKRPPTPTQTPPQEKPQHAFDALAAAAMHETAAREREGLLRKQTQEITSLKGQLGAAHAREALLRDQLQETKPVNTLLHEAEELAEQRAKELLRFQRKLTIAEAHVREYEFRSSQWTQLHKAAVHHKTARIASLEAEVAELKRVNANLRESSAALAGRVTDLKKYIVGLGHTYGPLPPMPVRHKRKMCEA